MIEKHFTLNKEFGSVINFGELKINEDYKNYQSSKVVYHGDEYLNVTKESNAHVGRFDTK